MPRQIKSSSSLVDISQQENSSSLAQKHHQLQRIPTQGSLGSNPKLIPELEQNAK